MSTPSSGYITARRNLTSHVLLSLEKSVRIPFGKTVMTSYKELTPKWIHIKLFHHFSRYDYRDCVCIRRYKTMIWDRYSDFKSDFAHMFTRGSEISVATKIQRCSDTNCFRLSFSFFSVRKSPQKLSTGLWNCSVDNYPSFQHHLACNLKTECEHGQDETEHCPFSNSLCRGLIAVCNSCYKIVESLRTFKSNQRNANIRAHEYCTSIGGSLGFPACLSKWHSGLLQLTRIHRRRLSCLWVGINTRDTSLPSMYRCVLVRNKTILYHAFTVYLSKRFNRNICLATSHFQSYLTTFSCRLDIFEFGESLYNGAVCEFNANKTDEYSGVSRAMSMICTQLVLSVGQLQSMTVCQEGHMTFTFLLCSSNQYEICGQEETSCDFSDQLLDIENSASLEHRVNSIPLFTCSNECIRLSYTQVCDFICDCRDKSDESLCEHHPCINQFTCSSGQCVSHGEICDMVSHCRDESDELCDEYQMMSKLSQYLPSPVLTNSDGGCNFILTPMKHNESCPDSHYRCPGELNDCLPVYTRCNGFFDCTDHQDEEGCEGMTCPGFFRCRASRTCVHSDQLCDGWPHCPMHDDELLCDMICPVGCLCQGHTFLCFQPFSAALFLQLRYLDATGSGMTASDVNFHSYLWHLVLAQCSLTLLPDMKLLNLRLLDLSANTLQQVNMTSFLGLVNLHTLSLSNNPLTSLHADFSAVDRQKALRVIDLSYVELTVFDSEILSSFPQTEKLNLTSTFIHTISLVGFQFMPQLRELYMDGSPVKHFPPDVFKHLRHLRSVHASNYKLCCSDILPYTFHGLSCHAPKDEISSCRDLLQTWVYRGFLWLIACLSMTGNIFCFCARLFTKIMTSSGGYSVFVTSLTMADFLTGVYIVIIGVADEFFRGRYLYHDDTWKSSVTCKVAGFLSLLSSEVSALNIWLITLDRFVVLQFPFSTLRFGRTSATVSSLLIWLVGWFIALVPLLPVTAHWEFYSQTGICIPLPVTRQEFKGRMYSFSVLIGLNFVLFLIISAGQGFIYQSIQKNALKSNTSKVSKDMIIARRLITVAVTDFLCWFPIGLCGILASADTPIPGEVNIALAIFILPLNSAINPFMYSLNILAEKRRKANETELLKFLQSHSDLIAA